MGAVVNCDGLPAKAALAVILAIGSMPKALAVDYGETTPDGVFTLEPVYCLGNCASSPSIRVDNSIVGRVDEALFDQVIADVEKIERFAVSSSTAESFSYQFYLSQDTSALAVHAEAVAQRLQDVADEAELEINLVPMQEVLHRMLVRMYPGPCRKSCIGCWWGCQCK